MSNIPKIKNWLDGRECAIGRLSGVFAIFDGGGGVGGALYLRVDGYRALGIEIQFGIGAMQIEWTLG